MTWWETALESGQSYLGGVQDMLPESYRPKLAFFRDRTLMWPRCAAHGPNVKRNESETGVCEGQGPPGA